MADQTKLNLAYSFENLFIPKFWPANIKIWNISFKIWSNFFSSKIWLKYGMVFQMVSVSVSLRNRYSAYTGIGRVFGRIVGLGRYRDFPITTQCSRQRILIVALRPWIIWTFYFTSQRNFLKRFVTEFWAGSGCSQTFEMHVVSKSSKVRERPWISPQRSRRKLIWRRRRRRRSCCRCSSTRSVV